MMSLWRAEPLSAAIRGDDTSISRDTGVMMSRCHAEICDTEDDEKWSQHFQSEIISETQSDHITAIEF